jgi:peptidyl-prolyl cis-trans isomerase B (cyclophilin B)
MALGSTSWYRIVRLLAVTVIAAPGLGLVGCNMQADQSRNVAQTKDKGSEDKDVANADKGNTTDPKNGSNAFDDKDPLHQPFAKATRQGDDLPSGWERPPDTTVTGKSVFKLNQEVVHQWETIRFVTEDGKKLAYSATIDTPMGSLDIDLRSDLAPNHVRNFVALARAGYYDGLYFDRIYHDESVEDPMQRFDEIEAGCPLGTGDPGYGGIGYWLNPEFSPSEKATHEEGTVGACRGFDKDSAACRFYITLCKFPNLDGNFTVFGKVRRGLDVARKIFEQPVIISPQDSDNSRRPEKPVVIQKVKINTRELDR